MIGRQFHVMLEENLSLENQNAILEKIQKTEGVFSAIFNTVATSPAPEIRVHSGGLEKTDDAILQIKGVKKISEDPFKRM
jgi:hypothetical protein